MYKVTYILAGKTIVRKFYTEIMVDNFVELLNLNVLVTSIIIE